MTFRLGCDLDGTLADMEGALQREATALFGPDVVLRPSGSPHLESPDTTEDSSAVPATTDPPVRKKGLSDRQVRQLWAHVATIDNFWTTLDEIEPGAVASLSELRRGLKLEIVFLTQRPETAGESTQLQSQRWLAAHGFELPSVCVLRGSRGKATATLRMDALLDDRPENCLDVISDSKTKPILVWRDPADSVPPGAARLGIETVFSIAEGLERLRRSLGA
jgi:hypothetical protein